MGLRLDQQFQWGDSPLQSDLRKFTQALELRFIPLESKLIDWKAAVDSLTSVGLDRLNTTLGPLLVRIQQAANLGFLVAIADNQTQTLVVNSPIGFFVTSEGKELFRPTPWLLISDNGDSTNWGLGQLQIYNEVTGELTVTMRYAAKTQAGTSWSISDNSGVIPVINAALSDAIDARDAAVAAEATVTASIGDLEELIAIVQSGPVISVAGHAGAVTLGVADIVGLTDALAAKAVGTEVSSALAGKQTASAKLTTMAGVTWAADNLLLLTGPTSCGTIALSAFIKSLLDDAEPAGGADDARDCQGQLGRGQDRNR